MASLPPRRLNDAALEHAEQRRLHLERQLADLVEEDRAAVRQLERAVLALLGARERAALVPEQLDAISVAGSAPQIDDDERPLGARADAS